MLIPISAIIMSSATIAVQDNNPEDYTLLALKNCQVVSESYLTEDQLSAYLSLQNEEKIMSGLEDPIKGVEKQLEEFSDRIEEVSALAVQELEGSIYIDEYYMKEQKDIVHQLNKLIGLHQKDFKAIAEQGKRIGKKAKVFKTIIESGLEVVDHDQIHIISPDSSDQHFSCNKAVIFSKM
jgi:hypothetical protein